MEQVLTSPRRASWAGRRRPAMGLDQEVVTTLRGRWARGWSRVVRLRRATGFGWGAACGRSAAAAQEERCRLGANRSLTREDSGGRDRV